MPSFRLQRTIQASPTRTFEVFTDFENMAENIRGVVKLELLGDGPVGQGTRFRETRVMFKQESTEEMEITAFEAPHRLTIHGDSCGALFDTTFQFAAEGDATRVDVEFTSTPVSLLAKLMKPLSGVMMKACRKAFEDDLDDLTAVAEGKAVGAAAPA